MEQNGKVRECKQGPGEGLGRAEKTGEKGDRGRSRVGRPCPPHLEEGDQTEMAKSTFQRVSCFWNEFFL